MRISKSKFVAGVQCLKRLYWQVHQPELAAKPDAATEAIMEQGHGVGMLARELFPVGVEVSSEGGLDQAIRATRELVANREVPAIFEGVFEHDGVLVRVDVLHRRTDGRFRLVEVKSSTSVKEEHLDDVGIQSRIVSRCGVDLASVCLAHINRNYIFNGRSIDVRRLFKMRNLTRRVQRLQPKLTFQLRAAFTVLSMPKAPDIAPGKHCMSPVTCEFFDRCNSPLPDDHIGYLPRLHASAEEELEEMGVESIRDIPDDFELSEIQRRAATCVQTGEAWFSTELKKDLESLRYPLCFADFESVNPAVPRFPGMRPYDQLPFQWSVHVLRQPGAEPEHYEFLATDASDPRREFIESLCNTLGESGNIVVYSAFESQRLSELGAYVPEFADRIKHIQARLWDLLPVVRNNVYHPAFAGSFSLKYVLPALVPEMTYAAMEVANGQDAGLAWESLVRGSLDTSERDKIRKALLDYCGQDTLAMVRLLEKLRSENRMPTQNIGSKDRREPKEHRVGEATMRLMADAYEVWLDQVKDALRSINMPMEDWQKIWAFDFAAECEKGTSPDAAAMKANRFWWREQNKSLKEDCREMPGCWLPRGHTGECQPVSKPTYEPGDYVKVEFAGEAGMPSEWMWVRVRRCDEQKKLVFGILDNEPVNDYEGNLELGSELAVAYSQIREHKKPNEFTRQ